MATSLLNLEEDLTCSICLCPFEGPVSLACGHSFCQRCLEAAWSTAGPVSCPHCRTVYAVRPELKRNTVLSAVADAIRGASDAVSLQAEPAEQRFEPKPKPKPVLCDTCMEAPAESTCMTCAASFCAEHVRPHRENPVYRAHRLVEPPLADLHHRLCTEHAKLLEFFCAPHERAICSGCLQEQHRGCSFHTVEEQREKKESELNDKLGALDSKIEKNQLVISQMKEQQAKLKDIAAVRKRALEAEYQQIRERLQRDEKEALNALEKDLESGQSKLNNLMKKFIQNIDKMSGAKQEINRLLGQSNSMDFLQVSVDMPSVVVFEPFAPRINLDSKNVIAYHACIASLKEHISQILSQPVENRISVFRADADKASPILPNLRETVNLSGSTSNMYFIPTSTIHAKGPAAGAREKDLPQGEVDHSPAASSIIFGAPKGPSVNLSGSTSNMYFIPTSTIHAKGPAAGAREKDLPLNPSGSTSNMYFIPTSTIHAKGPAAGAREKHLHREKNENRKEKKENRGERKDKDNKERRDHKENRSRKFPNKGMTNARSIDSGINLTENLSLTPVDVSSGVKRSDLLRYATILMFDPRTAHRRVVLSENNTKASVSDDPSAYPDVPTRFTVCSQVLCSKGFSQGLHYWEVKMSSNNFCGIGLAYGCIDRKGPTSRLGRNGQSWCIEWFNVKLSAWHNNNETVLVNPNPSRVGVLLNCDSGSATFYDVTDRAYPLHTFVFPFSEPVYPAFWIFSSGSFINLCKLNN